MYRKTEKEVKIHIKIKTRSKTMKIKGGRSNNNKKEF